MSYPYNYGPQGGYNRPIFRSLSYHGTPRAASSELWDQSQASSADELASQASSDHNSYSALSVNSCPPFADGSNYRDWREPSRPTSKAENVKVVVRIRPFIKQETLQADRIAVRAIDDTTVEANQLGKGAQEVSFDAVYGDTIDQCQIFDTCGVERMVELAISGSVIKSLGKHVHGHS